jgi:hypothetical protein
LKKEVGPFIVNTRAALQDAKKLLQDMGFQQGEIWIYDPHSIISTRRIGFGSTPYQHQPKSQLELLANQDSWEDVQRILQVQEKVPDQPSKSPVTKTPQQFEKTYKRKGAGSAQKMSEIEEGNSTKRKNRRTRRKQRSNITR